MRYFTYEERHRQHLAVVGARRLQQPAAVVVVRQMRLGVVLNILLASVFILLSNLQFLERFLRGAAPAAPGGGGGAAPAAAGGGGGAPEAPGGGAEDFLASSPASELVVSEGYFTYEERHRRHLAVAEGQRPQLLEEEEPVLLRAEVEGRRRQHLAVEALPLCS